MNHNAYLLLVGLYLFISCEKKEEHAKPYIAHQLDSLLIHEHNSNRFDGTIVIGTKDSVIYSVAIGTANRVWDVPLQLDHRFDICSINKSFVAALVLMAVEEGKLDLDDRFANLIQAHCFEGNFDESITIHQMLTHTSGMADYDGIDSDLSANHFLAFKRLHFSNEEYINFISKLAPEDQPGQTFHYSNFAYHLLTILLEDIYQLPFAELIEQKICEPLDLEHTFSTTSNREIHAKLVEAYNYNQENDRWERNQFIDLTLGRRIFSTAMDLYLWGKAMSDYSILSETSTKLMQTNYLTDISSEISYGYGWVVFDGEGKYRMGDLKIDKTYIIHGGSTEGYKSMLVNIEHGEFTIAMLANTGAQTNEMQLTQKIVQLLINSKNED